MVEDDLRDLISKLKAGDEAALEPLLSHEEITERGNKLTEFFVRRRVYSGNSTEASQLQQELLSRVSASLKMFLGSSTEASSAFWREFERNLLLSRQKRVNSVRRAGETGYNTDDPSELTGMPLDLVEWKRRIWTLPAEKRQVLQIWLRAWVDTGWHQDATKALINSGISAEEWEAVQELLLQAFDV